MIEDNVWTFLCPNCDSDKRLVQAVVDEDRAAKRLGEHIQIGATSISEMPITDQKKNPKPGDEVSVLMMFQDICQKCGTVYTFKITREIRKVSLDVSHLIQRPPSNLPPNFPGGNQPSRRN